MASRRRRLLVPLAGFLVLAWVVLVGLTLRAAYSDTRSGLRSVDRARAGADASAVVEGRLLPDLRTARARFAAAHRRVAGPLVAPLRLLPMVGRQLRSVSALSATATKVADAGISGMTDAQPVLSEPGGTVALRAAGARRLGELAATAGARVQGLDLGPRKGLIPTLADARNRLARQLAELEDALAKGSQGGKAVSDVLTGPRRYLVFAANNAEMRAGSGMFLSAGELETGPDGLRLGAVRSVTDIAVPPGSVPLTGDLADRWGWLAPNVEWRNLMTSPRFDVAAPLAAQMWAAAGNRPVDGVLALDPVALRAMLSATGDVEVDGRRIGEDNVEEELLHEQYVRFSADDQAERRDELGKVASSMFASLNAGSWSLPRLAAGLASAGAGRHLLLWSSQPGEQAAWRALGVDGALQPNSLLVSVLSRTGNKLDQFVAISAKVDVRSAGPQSELVVTLHIENRVPEGEPRYVAGAEAHSGVTEGVYLGIVTLDVPGAATDGYFDGVDKLTVAGDDGPSRVMGFQLSLDRGTSTVVVAHFRLPGHAGSVRVEPSARIPKIFWFGGATSWEDGSARLLTWKS